MNSDTSWLGIFDRTPAGRPDFAHTKPFTAAPAEDLALLFGAFGVQTLRASLVEVGSMHCTHAWHITEAGGMVEAPGDGDVDSAFASAMATIIHLNPAGAEQTLTRKLDPQCWAFAWPVDEHHVAVVEAHYRLTRSDQGDADAALVRHVCDAGMRAASGAAATTDVDDDNDVRPSTSAVVRLVPPAGRPQNATIASVAAFPAILARVPDPAPQAATGRRLRLSAWLKDRQRVVYAALALGLAAAAILFALLQHASALRKESARLQAQVDATMTQTVAKTLGEGDYGEVQAELAAFAALNYFERAVVTNARGRVIASVGPFQGVRMGDPLAPAVVASAHVIELDTRTGRVGQLLVWGHPAPDAPGQSGLAIAAVLAALGAAVAVAALLRRRHARGSAAR